jgi:hypothetical protein
MSPADLVRGQTVPRPSYLSFFSLVRDDSPQFVRQLVWLKGTARDFGWQQLTVGFSMTGMVDEWLELYRLPQNVPLLDKLASLEQAPDYQRLLGFCRTRRMELTRAMPYDPGLEQPPNQAQGHLLYSILELKADQEQRLIQAMAQLQELFREKTWSLVSASRSLTHPRYVVHLWQFEDAQMLHGLLEDKRYAVLERCCERQSHRLLRLQG